MNLLSETYKKRLQKLAGINEAWGTGNVSDVEREKAFSKTNERVPYKKDLMIYAIKGGFEIGLLFKTKNEKDQMPIAKYRTVFPVAIGINKRGNEVVSAFHKIGQSESKARETGRRSAEAKNEWRLFKTHNILSMWLTGEMFDTAPSGFKGSHDSRMTTVEAFFNPAEAKKIQAQQQAEKTQQTDKKQQMVNRGAQEPINKPIDKKPIAPKPTQKPVQKEPVKPIQKPVQKQPIIPVKKEEPIEKYPNRRIKRNQYPGEK